MFPALQPHRPKVNTTTQPQHSSSQSPPRSALSQQTRTLSSSQDLSKPQSQIEAMPPHLTSQGQEKFNDPALCHPVFFSSSFHKPPFALPLMPSSGFHPSATGYVFNSKKSPPTTKL